MTRPPVETAREMLAALQAGDIGRWEAVVAEDAALLVPYLPDGPLRFDGRESFRPLTWDFFRSWSKFEWQDVDLHSAQDDPDYVFGTGKSAASSDTRQYNNSYCYIFRIRGEQVVEYHEYFNPLQVAKAGMG